MRGSVGAVLLAAALALGGSAEAQERTSAELGAALDSMAGAAVEEGFSGQVLAVRDGEILLHRGYGQAGPDGGVAVDTGTVFAIGSVTKRFTRAAILRLEENGVLSRDDPLSRWLDGLPGDKRDITVGQLVDMAAGLHEYHDTRGDHEPMTRDEALRRIAAQELLFEPGSDRAYSNSGYTLLAAVIEEASGVSYEEYLRRALFEPAGMRRTGFHGEDRWPDEDVARGYGMRTHGDNAPHHWPSPTWALKGSGGMVAPASDLLRFIRALRAGDILGRDGVADLYPEDEPHLAYAGGDDFGFITLVMELDRGRHVVIVNTNSGFRAEALGRELAEVVRGEPLPGRRVTEERPDAEEDPSEGGEPRQAVPDSPRARAATSFLDALADGSTEALETLVRDGFTPAMRDVVPMAEHLVLLRSLASRMEEEGVRGMRPVAEFTVAIVLEGGDQVILDVEPREPYRIEGVRIGGG